MLNEHKVSKSISRRPEKSTQDSPYSSIHNKRNLTTDFSLREASEAFNFCETRKGFYLQSKATQVVTTSDYTRKTQTKFCPSPGTKKRIAKAVVSFYLPH